MSLPRIVVIFLIVFSSKIMVAQNSGVRVPVCKALKIVEIQTFVTGGVFTKEGGQIFPVLTKIIVKGTDIITSTNHAGTYKLNITDALKSKVKITLLCEALGYFPKEITLDSLLPQFTSLDFDLTENRIKK